MPSATAPPTALPPSFNAYRILSLPAPFTATASSPSSSFATQPQPHTPAAIKAAYRRALLTHHPDKSVSSSSASSASSAGTAENAPPRKTTAAAASHTVDDITAAYRTLLDPGARAAHDRALRLRLRLRGNGGDRDAEEEWRLGLEAVDLDDLAFDDGAAGAGEGEGTWWRGCRCGEERGFVVSEGALERAGEVGEVLVGCVGCSLWIRVGFAVAEEEEEEEGE